MGSSGAPTRVRRVTVDDVVEAGVAITAADGLGAVTVRAVAARLGVRSPSLYHHLPGGLEELRSRVVERVRQLIDTQEPAPEDAPTWERLEVPLRSVGRASTDYPGVLEHILTTGKDGPTTLHGADRTVQLLLESELAGVAPEAFVAVHAYVTGWIFAQRPTSEAAQEHGLSALADVLRDAEQLDQEKVLIDGLRALIAGLALTQEPARRGRRVRRPGRSAGGGRSRAG
jgi:AcrR family transcriptional regulator